MINALLKRLRKNSSRVNHTYKQTNKQTNFKPRGKVKLLDLQKSNIEYKSVSRKIFGK